MLYTETNISPFIKFSSLCAPEFCQNENIQCGWWHKFRQNWSNCSYFSNSWWRHQMETFYALLAICAGNSPVPGEFPTKRPVTRSFDVFFDLRLNKWLSKQSWGWWFGTLSCPLWRHCNVLMDSFHSFISHYSGLLHWHWDKRKILRHKKNDHEGCGLAISHAFHHGYISFSCGFVRQSCHILQDSFTANGEILYRAT